MNMAEKKKAPKWPWILGIGCLGIMILGAVGIYMMWMFAVNTTNSVVVRFSDDLVEKLEDPEKKAEPTPAIPLVSRKLDPFGAGSRTPPLGWV